MLTKAILTGGVLSVLAGTIVYFGTEGADALEANPRASLHVEETDLAGASDVAVGDVRLMTLSFKMLRAPLGLQKRSFRTRRKRCPSPKQNGLINILKSQSRKPSQRKSLNLCCPNQFCLNPS